MSGLETWRKWFREWVLENIDEAIGVPEGCKFVIVNEEGFWEEMEGVFSERAERDDIDEQ